MAMVKCYSVTLAIYIYLFLTFSVVFYFKGGFFGFLKVVGNEKVGGSGMCQTVPIWLGPRRSRFVSLSILPSPLI